MSQGANCFRVSSKSDFMRSSAYQVAVHTLASPPRQRQQFVPMQADLFERCRRVLWIGDGGSGFAEGIGLERVCGGLQAGRQQFLHPAGICAAKRVDLGKQGTFGGIGAHQLPRELGILQ
jgi:hypothetical protein